MKPFPEQGVCNPIHLICFLVCLATIPWAKAAASLGEFESGIDIGRPAKAGSAEYQDSSKQLTITGGGANMWFTNDAFHFVWKKISGDVALTATVELLGKGADPHRKACLMLA